jgi:hypothetical protein
MRDDHPITKAPIAAGKRWLLAIGSGYRGL